MKLTFIETLVFTVLATDLLEDEDYQQMQEYLLIYPAAGAVIVGTAGCQNCVGEFQDEEVARAGDASDLLLQECLRSNHIPAGIRPPLC